MITLEQLLESRDRRSGHQMELLGKHPGSSVVCLTVQLPGSEKRNSISLAIADAGLKALRDAFPGFEPEVRDLETGFEAYLTLAMPAVELKRICCGIEDSHPLGRLMDIDVICADGPLGRARVGLEPRKCLLCSNEARLCMRMHSHTREELLEKIGQMVDAYVRKS
ncbi:MAG: citrate lyase holo-[acyl-carrier protein] synthase [Bacteroidales bacterium]|nr:citrate lyase holo-[acyl-carrier protein] synthase [Bacteroidales bacterium]